MPSPPSSKYERAQHGRTMPPDKTASSRRWLLTMLYWFGVLLVLIGVVFRFYFGQLQLGISLAVVGVGLLLLARLNSKLMR